MAGRGRHKTLTGDSREDCKCPVCPETGRLDNLKKRHVLKLIVWSSDDDDLPAKESEEIYKSASQEEKKHTDYWRVNNYSRSRFPTFKRVIQHSTSTLTFFLKRPRISNNNNPGEVGNQGNYEG